MQQYHSRYSNEYVLDPKKTPYDPLRYGWQYTSKQIREGLTGGRQWVNRIDRSTMANPALENIQSEHRMIWLLAVLDVPLIFYVTSQNSIQWNREYYAQMFSKRAFIDRYSYKTHDVEFQTPYDPTERGFS